MLGEPSQVPEPVQASNAPAQLGQPLSARTQPPVDSVCMQPKRASPSQLSAFVQAKNYFSKRAGPLFPPFSNYHNSQTTPPHHPKHTHPSPMLKFRAHNAFTQTGPFTAFKRVRTLAPLWTRNFRLERYVGTLLSLRHTSRLNAWVWSLRCFSTPLSSSLALLGHYCGHELTCDLEQLDRWEVLLRAALRSAANFPTSTNPAAHTTLRRVTSLTATVSPDDACRVLPQVARLLPTTIALQARYRILTSILSLRLEDLPYELVARTVALWSSWDPAAVCEHGLLAIPLRHGILWQLRWLYP
eukprot:g54024.t1